MREHSKPETPNFAPPVTTQYCRACDQRMNIIYSYIGATQIGAMMEPLSPCAFYCDNRQCVHFGYLTTRGLPPKFPADRCRVCGWTLAASIAEGCVPGNCSRRPAPERRADEGYRAEATGA